jgi:hypothetical protein
MLHNKPSPLAGNCWPNNPVNTVVCSEPKRKRVVFLIAMTLVASAVAGEPNVVEWQRGDGLTELRIESGAGQVIATYQLDLNRHHQPAFPGENAL